MPVRVNALPMSVFVSSLLFLGGLSCTAPRDVEVQEEPALVLTDRRGESAERILTVRFSFSNSLGRLDQIRQALESFRDLTEASKGRLSRGALTKAGNTDGTTQYIGFPNWTSSVEGTLRYQEYQIRKLEFELTKLRHHSRKIEESELRRREKAFRESEQAFLQFWESFHIVD